MKIPFLTLGSALFLFCACTTNPLPSATTSPATHGLGQIHSSATAPDATYSSRALPSRGARVSTTAPTRQAAANPFANLFARATGTPSTAPAPSTPSRSSSTSTASPGSTSRRASSARSFSMPFSFGGIAASTGRYRLSGSGSTLTLTNATGSQLDTISLDGERAVRIKPGRGDSFLIATSGGNIVKAVASGGQLRETVRTPALGGSTSDFLEGKDGSIHVVSRSGGRVQVNSFHNGSWRPNQAVSSSLTDFQTMKLDPGTGEVIFLGKTQGSNRLAVIRSNSSGSQTDSFLLPPSMSLVSDIACIDDQIYVASGRGKNGTLSVFGPDGTLKSSVVTGELSSLTVTYKNGKPVISAAGANGEAMEFETGKALDKQAPAGEAASTVP